MRPRSRGNHFVELDPARFSDHHPHQTGEGLYRDRAVKEGRRRSRFVKGDPGPEDAGADPELERRLPGPGFPVNGGGHFG